MMAAWWGLCLAGWAQLPLPPGKVYWSDRGSDQILRADFDGANPELLVDAGDIPGSSNQLRGLALDNRTGTVYFCDNSANRIFRMRLDGLRQVEPIVSDLDFPADITLDLDAGKVYWCDQSQQRGNVSGVIQRANLDGSAVEDVVVTPRPYFLTLDTAGGKLYWGDFSGGNIFRANLADGSNVETLVTGIGGRTRGVQLDLAGGMIYWVNRNEGKIQRRDLDGGPVEDVYSGLDTPHGMVLDIVARKVYWADTGSNSGSGHGENLINRGDMDGSGAQELLSVGVAANDPWDVVLDTRPAAFPLWQARFFRKDRGAIAAENSDPDHDGLVNALECALGSHPLAFGVVPQPIAVGGNKLGVEFVRQTTPVPAMTTVVEQSPDLITWSASGVTLRSTESLADPSRERVVFQSESGGFLRLRAAIVAP